MSDISFWKPFCQSFKPDEPLIQEDLRDFYVRRDDSPVDQLMTLLAMGDADAKFLLAGHRGGGKTTELRRLEQRCSGSHTVIWVDTDTALDKFNIGYAEVVVLIGIRIVEKLEEMGWKLPKRLEKELIESLSNVTYEEKVTSNGQLELPKLFQDLGMKLKAGFQQETTKKRDVRPVLSEILKKVNAIIEAAEADKPKLLVIVDGLDRKDYGIALEMFSSSLLTDLKCHTIYAIPISLRYSTAFRQPMQSFGKCLDLDNIPVFKCDAQRQPTIEPDRTGRHILSEVITKRLKKLGEPYQAVVEGDALDFLCENSGGVMRDLVRLVRISGEVAVNRKAKKINLDLAQEAIREDYNGYTILDYQYAELDHVHQKGTLTTNVIDLPKYGKLVICEELLHYKLILGYRDPKHGRWFNVNPILLPDLKRWQAAKESI